MTTHRSASAPESTRQPTRSLPRLSNRTFLLIALVVGIVVIRVVRDFFFDGGREPSGWMGTSVSWLSLFWAAPALGAALGVLGFLLHRGPTLTGKSVTPPPTNHLVCFRIVSRGTNPAALHSTIEAAVGAMAQRPLFPWRIEVVTDQPVNLGPPDPRVHPIVVPTAYSTPHGSRFKARALHYALIASDLPDDAWLFHLDEESHVSVSLVEGICAAVEEEERTGKLRIGQGLILYHNQFSEHPVLTLADMIRTGDDLGRFYLQQRLGFTVFGLHGSFILVRNDIEKRTGFDFGPEGSITEDAFWALREMAVGSRSRWVEGSLVEQSTQSTKDFVKQRRRWFSGMVRTVLYADSPWQLRVPLAVFTALWSVSWLSMLYTVANIFLGYGTLPVLTALADFTLATFAATYLVGLRVNLADMAPQPVKRKAMLYVGQVVLLPVFGVLEAAAVLFAIGSPERGFHVVAKSRAERSPAERPALAQP